MFVLKLLSAYNVCSIYSNALQDVFTLEGTAMNPDQTAPEGSAWSGSIVFTIKATKVERRVDFYREWWERVIFFWEINQKYSPCLPMFLSA